MSPPVSPAAMTSAPRMSPKKASAPSSTAWDAPVFVSAVWAVMAAAAFWFTWTYGSKYPYFDDFGLTQWLSGEEPVTPHWLWEQHADHRIPVPKLLWVT